MPLRRVNQKPKNPAERIDTWAGPRLEEFYGGGKPAIEEKPAIVEAPKISPFHRLTDEMKKRGWSPSPSLAEHGFRRKAESAWIGQLLGPVNNGKWEAYYSSGGTAVRVIRSPPVDTPDLAVDELPTGPTLTGQLEVEPEPEEQEEEEFEE